MGDAIKAGTQEEMQPVEEIAGFPVTGFTVPPERAHELLNALAMAKARMGPIPRSKSVKVATRSGGSYTFKYAPLDVILAVITPALSEFGLSILQDCEWDDGKVAVSTVLAHSSGQLVTLARMEGVTVVKEVDFKTGEVRVRDMSIQERGSLITYLRRYSVTTALCLSSEDDEDGNLADGNSAETVHESSVGLVKLDKVLLEKINACKTMAELADLWSSLTDEQRLAAVEAKNARKYLLAKTGE